MGSATITCSYTFASPPPPSQFHIDRYLQIRSSSLSIKAGAYYPARGRVGTDREHEGKHSWKVISPSDGISRGNFEATGIPTSVPLRVAYELVLAGHRCLDVRTPEEFSAGHAAGAVNIPYFYTFGSGMTRNPNFLAQVLSRFRKDDEIVIGCESGEKSFMAASQLLALGFNCITDIAGGFDAWTRNGLPTEF